MVRGCRLMEKGQLPKGQRLEVIFARKKKKEPSKTQKQTHTHKKKGCKGEQDGNPRWGVREPQKGGRVVREKEKLYSFTSCFH